MPGVPEFTKSIFRSIEHMFNGEILLQKEFDLDVDEGRIAERLRRLIGKFSEIKLGSYRGFSVDGHCVKLVLKHRNKKDLEEAEDYLVELIGGYMR